ncbi:MAG: hypothetical protein WD009_05955 [Phycisphaeraceae bacterium]
MALDIDAIARRCPEADPARVRHLLGRVDAEYHARFDEAAIAEHVGRLTRLDRQNPVETILEERDTGHVACTVLAFDHPFEFSLITGVLAATGLRIETGDIFTLPPVDDVTGGEGRATTRRRPNTRGATGKTRHAPTRAGDPARDAVIIDHFQGQLVDVAGFEAWSARCRELLERVIRLLEKRDETSRQQAQKLVNEWVTQRLAAAQQRGEQVLLPMDLHIQPLHTSATADLTRITIVGQDTPAFLYTLATALSLRGLDIRRVRIGNEADGRVRDEIDVLDPQRRGHLDQPTIERVRLSVLLTKQFTYFLGQSPDPFAALQRFGRLIDDLLAEYAPGETAASEQWMQLLTDPRAMKELARLLGTSDYLWEDFIRGQYESLLPVLGPHLQGERIYPPMETLPLRLEQAMHGAVGVAEQRDRLNRFKDREIYLIDLDYILTPNVDFRDLSLRLTTLAENLVAIAADAVYDDLVHSYGHPLRDKPAPSGDRQARYAVCGLGKLGGVALGYASDIELLFLYSGPGRTVGGKRGNLSNAEFFETHAKETATFIRTKREGIFEVDTRLRPYGKDGPLAISLDHFERYYILPTDASANRRHAASPPSRKPEEGVRAGKAKTKTAHPFERLALVRLRWIAGDPRLGYDIERTRDHVVYEQGAYDLDALWELWGKQKQQKLANADGQPNAKYSPGTLVDLEGAVQLLQVHHASEVPQLRSPRVSLAMEALRRADILSPRVYAELSMAYRFFRRLINGLRMLRGNARDLFLPAPDADEFTHLARRLHYRADGERGPAEQLRDDFQTHSHAVRSFIREHFDRPCPGE